MNNLWKSADAKALNLAIGSKTAFGELNVSEFTPQCGWSFAYNINPIAFSFNSGNGGSVSQENSFAKLETSTSSNGFAYLRTNRPAVYNPGQGSIARFTVMFDTPQADSLQLIGVGNDDDGWFFGYDGLKFGILRRRNNVDNWIYQEDWNIDTKPRLNPQLGNVYQIKYQWLGFGMQYFAIEDEKGNLSDVHRIEYANLNDDVSVYNASLPLACGVGNLGNTSNIVLKTPSAVAGVQGKSTVSAFTVPVGYSLSKAITAGQNYLFSMRLPDTFQGKDNRLFVEPKIASFATDGTKNVKFLISYNSILTNPVWTDINTDVTPLQYDESATAITNGQEILPLVLGKTDSKILDFTPLDIQLNAGQSFSVIAVTTGASDVELGVAFRSRI